ncbi:MAG: DNA repair protein RecN [Candidatus Lambdaproteobacteria bacterium]|nr:DNA repair protein RecN [Candidatus Lambdaproteobacteria bacterium]
MLTRLAIANLATIETLSLEFAKGFSVLTGETGAGKSILIDALRFVLGGRASAEQVRSGASQTLVEATFELERLPEVRALLERLGIPAERELVLRRVLLENGRSRALANDCSISQANLEALGQLLVNIHGQHDNQQLLDPGSHIRFLDAFAKLEGAREAVAEHHRAFTQLVQGRARLQQQAAAREQRRAELAALLEDVDAARPQPQEEQELRAEHHRLTHAERLAQLTQAACDQLDEGERALLPTLAGLGHLIEQAAAIDKALVPLAEPVRAARFQLEDLYRTLSAHGARVEADPNRLERVNQRLAELERLARRYGGSLAEALGRAAAARVELEALERAEESLAALEGRLAEVAGRLHRSAEALTAQRSKAAARLTALIAEQLRELGMEKVVCETLVQPLESPEGRGPVYTPGGSDRVEFLFSSNPGQPPRSLARIASGGELSRVMLALKTILARTDPTRTLIFDEVDAGIGGALAEIVGNKLRRLGETHQVLCVTHLPQIAAQGAQHILIAKETRNRQTYTRATPLDGERQVQEVARLLSGVDVSEHSLASAQEMISRGRQRPA